MELEICRMQALISSVCESVSFRTGRPGRQKNSEYDLYAVKDESMCSKRLRSQIRSSAEKSGVVNFTDTSMLGEISSMSPLPRVQVLEYVGKGRRHGVDIHQAVVHLEACDTVFVDFAHVVVCDKVTESYDLFIHVFL